MSKRKRYTAIIDAPVIINGNATITLLSLKFNNKYNIPVRIEILPMPIKIVKCFLIYISPEIFETLIYGFYCLGYTLLIAFANFP